MKSNTTKKKIEGEFANLNAISYLNKSGFSAEKYSLDKASKEPGYFERFHAPGKEAYAGYIGENKIEIEIFKY